LAAGFFHTVARRSDGWVVAWGNSGSGQCDLPALPPGSVYAELSAGESHSVARYGPDGTVLEICEPAAAGVTGGCTPDVA
jgi:hypothetical protein